MPQKESEAIILRSFPLGEGDRLVSFLDRQSGRLRGVARGARMPKSRFGSTLEMLSYVRIWYFERENRELVQINQCELLESFLLAQSDYESGVLLALVSEVTDSVLGEREAADAQFRLILLTARAIKQHGPSRLSLAYFCLWTVRLGGWLGPLNACVHCGASLDSEAAAYASSMGLVCGNCKQEWMTRISPAGLKLGLKILSGTLDSALRGTASNLAVNEILSYALDVLEQQIEKKLVTRKMLGSGEQQIAT